MNWRTEGESSVAMTCLKLYQSNNSHTIPLAWSIKCLIRFRYGLQQHCLKLLAQWRIFKATIKCFKVTLIIETTSINSHLIFLFVLLLLLSVPVSSTAPLSAHHLRALLEKKKRMKPDDDGGRERARKHKRPKLLRNMTKVLFEILINF